MLRIDLNSDIGENIGDDVALMDIVSSVNIACGAHAGNLETMENCVRLAINKGVAIGAHPGYPDKENFGRVFIPMEESALYQTLEEQIKSIKEITEKLGGRLNHVKPHGALYNYGSRDEITAQLIVQVIKDIDPKLILFGLPNSVMSKVAKKAGIRFAAEGFSDRAYQADGNLVSRSEPGAVIKESEAVAARAQQMAIEKTVTAISGETLSIPIETLCLHGDTSGAVELAKAISEKLKESTFQIAPLRRRPMFAPLGDSSLQVTLGTGISEALVDDVIGLYKATKGAEYDWIKDLVPTYTGLMVNYDPALIEYPSICEMIDSESHKVKIEGVLDEDIIEVPTLYGGEFGPDLEKIAEDNSLSAQEVIKRHSQVVYRVYMMGFKPGFAYFGGLDPTIDGQRLTSPRVRIPAGSVGIADGQTGIYPLEGPGGWNLIGRTPLKIFDPNAASPCFLRAGVRVRFVSISKEQFLQLKSDESDGKVGDLNG
jgi:UPF0271 protein